MQALTDKLLVYAPQRHDTALGVAGVNGLELVKATSYDEEIHRAARVKVAASPRGLNPSKGSLEGTKYSTTAIRDIPAAGDTVYVDWSALNDSNQHDPYENPHLYWVGLDQVVAVPDGCGGYLGFAGYVLLEPVFPATVVEEKAVGQVTASGIFLVSDVKEEPKMGEESNIAEQVPTRDGIAATPYEGRVAYTGVPLKHQADEVRGGDHVLIDRRVCGRKGYPLRVTLEGEQFYAVRRDDIAAVRQRATQDYQRNELPWLQTEDTQYPYRKAA